MSSGSGLEDFSLMDLFRAEVETHSEVLSAALLALERSPGDTSRVEEMMRAAHSIKGAARVVGVDPAVSVAHVMEDCFVAAQKGTLTLSPGDVDVLLRGVDLLGKISEATRDPKADLANDLRRDGEVPRRRAGGDARPAGASRAEVRPRSRRRPALATAVAGPGRESGHAPLRRRRRRRRPARRRSRSRRSSTAAAAEEIRRQFLSAVERGCDSVRIDLRATKDLDVQGLALLAAIPRHAAQHGRPRLQLAGVSAEMETVLGVTGLDGSYGVRPGSTPEDA